jgi:hypothetical protein
LKTFTILVDKRENTPFVVPTHLDVLKEDEESRTTVRINIEEKTLKTGDYALKGFEDVCLVERKNSLEELFGNYSPGDVARWEACLDRLADSCRYPVVAVEWNPMRVRQPVRPRQCPPVPACRVLDRLLRDVTMKGISLCYLPGGSMMSRRAAGEIVARTLINAAIASTGASDASPSDAD